VPRAILRVIVLAWCRLGFGVWRCLAFELALLALACRACRWLSRWRCSSLVDVGCLLLSRTIGCSVGLGFRVALLLALFVAEAVLVVLDLDFALALLLALLALSRRLVALGAVAVA
jgi:hypothetical protein